MLSRLWEPGTAYHKAGVVLDGLEPPGTGQQLGLFDAAPARVVVPDKPALLTQRPGLMASMDALNSRFGRGTVQVATALAAPALLATTKGTSPPWEGKAHWRSPAFTTRLEDLLQVN